jgi:hypothetical protein
MQLALNGDVLAEEIDDFVDAWHEGEGAGELHEFLGMTNEEYSLWIANPDFLEIILAARYKHQSLSKAVNDNVQPSTRLAARSDQSWKVALLRRWIEERRGRRSRD